MSGNNLKITDVKSVRKSEVMLEGETDMNACGSGRDLRPRKKRRTNSHNVDSPSQDMPVMMLVKMEEPDEDELGVQTGSLQLSAWDEGPAAEEHDEENDLQSEELSRDKNYQKSLDPKKKGNMSVLAYSPWEQPEWWNQLQHTLSNSDEKKTPSPSSGTNKRRRKTIDPDWAVDETIALLKGCIKHKNVIHGHYTGPGGGKYKVQIWDQILASVNTVSRFVRTRKSCETRLRCYCSKVRRCQTREQRAIRTNDAKITPEQHEMLNLTEMYVGMSKPEGCPEAWQYEREEMVERDRVARDKLDTLRKKAAYGLRRASLRREEVEEKRVEEEEETSSREMEGLFTRTIQPKPNPDDSEDSVVASHSSCASTRTRPRKGKVTGKGKAKKPPEEVQESTSSIGGWLEALTTEVRLLRTTIATLGRDILGQKRGVAFVDTEVQATTSTTTRSSQTHNHSQEPKQNMTDRELYSTLNQSLSDFCKSRNGTQWLEVLNRASNTQVGEMEGEEMFFRDLLKQLGKKKKTPLLEVFLSSAPEILKDAAVDPTIKYKAMVLTLYQMSESLKLTGFKFYPREAAATEEEGDSTDNEAPGSNPSTSSASPLPNHTRSEPERKT